MSRARTPPTPYQRNALAPGLIAAATLLLAPVLVGVGWSLLVLYVASILALITGWFAVQAKQWWWVPVFVAIALVWNPVVPMPFTGPLWSAAQPVAAAIFLAAGATIRVRAQ